jgi:uncharacterized paraquat-inducible protein A
MLGELFFIGSIFCLFPALNEPAFELQGFHQIAPRSTAQGISELFDRGYWFPGIVLAFSSLVLPVFKTVLTFIGFWKPKIFFLGDHCLEIRGLVRSLSKFQFIDIYVVVILMGFLQNSMVQMKLLSGFHFFVAYCMLSTSSAILLDQENKSSKATRKPERPSLSFVEKFLTFSSISMWLSGIIWSLLLPVLAIRFVFDSKLVVDESAFSLFQLWKEVSECSVPLTLIFTITVLIIPSILFLAGTRSFYKTGSFTGILTKQFDHLVEWAHMDMFGIALVTAVFVFNSFDNLLRSEVPWGFYAMLMVSMSSHELFKLSRHGHDTSSPSYTAVDEDLEATKRQQEEHQLDHQSFPKLIAKIMQKLGITFFVIKAIGWAVFFLLWYINSGREGINLTVLNQTLTGNLPLVSQALSNYLPESIGNGQLFYEKKFPVEILARNMTGFKTSRILDMKLQVFPGDELQFDLHGIFDEISLSLYIGQCLTPFLNNAKIPICPKVFDNIHKWKDVKWTVKVKAQCNPVKPYVRELKLNSVTVDSSMIIKESLIGIIDLNVEDLSKRFKEGIENTLKPLIENNDSDWIPWGQQKYNLSGLLSHLINLNTPPGDSKISCSLNY